MSWLKDILDENRRVVNSWPAWKKGAVMTRKEELERRALSFLANEHVEPSDLTAMLLQVEREVWERVAEHCHYKHNDGYTLNDVLGCGNEGDVVTGASNDELRNIEEWARAQQQELT